MADTSFSNMTTINIGKVSFTPAGEYNPETMYEFLDVISYKGSGYVVRQSCKGVEPTDGKFYMKVASKGDPGTVVTNDCTTPGNTQNNKVELKDFELYKGAIVTVKFLNTNTAADATLNVNNTGDKPIYYEGSPILPGCLLKNHSYAFVFNGEYYEVIGDLNTDHTYVASDATPEPASSEGNPGSSNEYSRADHVHPLPEYIDADHADEATHAGAADTATSADKLGTAHTISIKGKATAEPVSFDGTQDVELIITKIEADAVSGSVDSATHADQADNATSAESADKLAEAHQFNVKGAVTGTAVSFDGTDDVEIDVTSVDGTKVTNSVPKADKLNTARMIGDAEFDGTSNITLEDMGAASAEDLKNTNDAVIAARSIAEGRSRGIVFADYTKMVAELNEAESGKYNIGDNLFILKMEVPDLWICDVDDESEDYEYITDATLLSALADGPVKIGLYSVSRMETAKVDLTELTALAQKGVDDAAAAKHAADTVQENLDSAKDELEGAIESASQEASAALESAKAELKSEIESTASDLEDKIDANKNAIDSLTSDLESTAGDIRQELEQAVSKADSDLSAAKEELQGSIQSAEEDLEGKIGSAKTEIQGEISSTKDELQQSIDAAQAAADKASADLESAESSLKEEIKKVGDTANAAIESAKEELQESIDGIDALKHIGTIDELSSDMLTAENAGKVYGLSKEFTLTEDFVEYGSYVKYPSLNDNFLDAVGITIPENGKVHLDIECNSLIYGFNFSDNNRDMSIQDVLDDVNGDNPNTIIEYDEHSGKLSATWVLTEQPCDIEVRCNDQPIEFKAGPAPTYPAGGTVVIINAGDDVYKFMIIRVDTDVSGFETKDDADKKIQEIKNEYSKIPDAHAVVLDHTKWNDDQQIVNVTGVDADETKQMISWMPTNSDMDACDEAGIKCIAQGDGTLTFKYSTVPSDDITVYVTIQDVNFSE